LSSVIVVILLINPVFHQSRLKKNKLDAKKMTATMLFEKLFKSDGNKVHDNSKQASITRNNAGNIRRALRS